MIYDYYSNSKGYARKKLIYKAWKFTTWLHDHYNKNQCSYIPYFIFAPYIRQFGICATIKMVFRDETD